MYERYATQYMRPWTLDLVGLAALEPGDRVLDLACGTGAVARHAAAQLGPTDYVTGLDLNAGMLTVARATPRGSGATIHWIEGSAVAMDLPDASFDVVLCQQGLQFFPDRLAALREIHRVLVPGGRALLSVWRLSPNPYNVAAGKAFEMYVDAETSTKYRAARAASPDPKALQSMMVEAGFQEVQIRPRAMIVHLPSIETFVLGHLSSGPVANAVSALNEERRIAFGRQVRKALQPYAEGEGVAIPDEINIAIGYK
jgi:ubiquinone/menaquinone biosynthesis C-methylase UbiE